MLTILIILIILSIAGIFYAIRVVHDEHRKDKLKYSSSPTSSSTSTLKKEEIEAAEEYCRGDGNNYLDTDEIGNGLDPIKPYSISEEENKMTITEFDSKVAKAEKGKKQTHIGNVREVRKKIGLEISKVSKEDLLDIAEKYNGKDLLAKIIKKLK